LLEAGEGAPGPKAASLFAGDNVLGEGTAVIAPPDGDMRAYMASLERLRSLELDRIFPGHFRPLDGGRAVIDGYIAHRRQREARILAALEDGPASMDEIVAIAYADTPAALHPVARYSAQAHLEMLESDGRARRIDDHWEALGVE
jgi:glyoxylase-like metal-dependent hydrolase (beta-lactamase superfamily II)